MFTNELLKNYIKNPNPQWDKDVANFLIAYKWNTSLKEIFPASNNYSITGSILKDEKQKEETYLLLETNGKIQIAFPSDNLIEFYNKHGLIPMLINSSSTEQFTKINRALKVLGNIPPLHSCILQLVRSIQIIEPDNSETDISYSHPNIPFSIFFSVCEDNSVISDLRVAESMLHESMHLFLSLLETHTDLIVPASDATFYSPWRDEERPVRGVFHGIFVFKAIKDFYKLLGMQMNFEQEGYFFKNRVEEIRKEFEVLIDFPKSEGLTYLGKELAEKLLL